MSNRWYTADESMLRTPRRTLSEPDSNRRSQESTAPPTYHLDASLTRLPLGNGTSEGTREGRPLAGCPVEAPFYPRERTPEVLKANEIRESDPHRIYTPQWFHFTPASTISIALWNVAGALHRPKGMQRNCQAPAGVTKAVRSLDSSATGICQYPDLQIEGTEESLPVKTVQQVVAAR